MSILRYYCCAGGFSFSSTSCFKKVCLERFEELLFTFFGIELNEQEKAWFAGDGKELRGSIAKGAKRGEVLVDLVSHGDKEVLAQRYYQGQKESEKTCLVELLMETGASHQKITADALHLSPKKQEAFF